MSGFFPSVYGIVALIPPGRVTTYGRIAAALGQPRGAQKVGWAMRHCPEGLPWQRVVMADGSVTGGAYAEIRRALLEGEGIPFLPDGRVDMEQCGWTPGMP